MIPCEKLKVTDEMAYNVLGFTPWLLVIPILQGCGHVPEASVKPLLGDGPHGLVVLFPKNETFHVTHFLLQ
jgi:hypothetical protein